MDYKIITQEEDFIKEKHDWDRIYHKMADATPFQTWEWNYFWWKNNEPEDSLLIIKAFEGKKTYGFAPLILKNNTVEFIGGKDSDYGRFIVFEKQIAVIQGIIEKILYSKWNIHFQEMNSGNSQLHIVQRITEDKKRYLCKKTTRTAYIITKEYSGYEEYFMLLSQSMRNKTIKYGLKQGVVISAEKLNDNLFREIDEIYNNRQAVRGGQSNLLWAFPMISEMNANGLLDVYIARKEGEAIGFLVAMKDSKAYYIWLVAFKMEYRNCFPGQLLFNKVINDSFENGFSKIDFMRGDYDFKMRWECLLDTNYSIYVFQHFFPYLKSRVLFFIRKKLKRVFIKHQKIKRLYKKICIK